VHDSQVFDDLLDPTYIPHFSNLIYREFPFGFLER